MKIGLWATDTCEFMALYLYQLKKAGIPYEIAEGVSWERGNGWANRMRWFAEFARREKGTILLTDPWDNVFLGDIDELTEKVQSFKAPLIWSAERLCWPDALRASEFPDLGTPFRFPCGGGIVGEAELLADLLDPAKIPGFGLPNYDMTKVSHPDGNQIWLDQVYFQDLYLSGQGVLDYTCKIFQALINHGENDFFREGDRLRSTLTGERPMFFHANGKVKLPKVLMDLIEEAL